MANWRCLQNACDTLVRRFYFAILLQCAVVRHRTCEKRVIHSTRDLAMIIHLLDGSSYHLRVV
jgi:hypothetical protein